MRQLRVTVSKDREILIAFSHPWRKLDFRGEKDVPIKVTNCIVAQPIKNSDKPKCRFYGFAQVKWPLIAKKNDKGEPIKGLTRSTLRGERLSKTNGCRLALAQALKNIKAQSPTTFTYEDRCEIWNAFHIEFKTGVVPVPTITTALAVVLH